MPSHSLYPGFIRLHYTSNGHPHRQVLPVNADPTPSGDSYTIPTKASGSVDWQTAIAAWAALVAANLDTDSSVDFAELYNFEAFPGPGDFLQAVAIGIAGTAAGANTPFSQIVFPFKGVGGLSLRPYIMEQVTAPDQKGFLASDMFAGRVDLMNFVLSDDDWIALRGGGFPTVSLGWVSKVNDQLRKRYFNP